MRSRKQVRRTTRKFSAPHLVIRRRIRYDYGAKPSEEGGATMHTNLITRMSVCAAPLGLSI